MALIAGLIYNDEKSSFLKKTMNILNARLKCKSNTQSETKIASISQTENLSGNEILFPSEK